MTFAVSWAAALSAESEVMAYHLPDGTKVSLMPHSTLSYQEDDCRKVEMRGR